MHSHLLRDDFDQGQCISLQESKSQLGLRNRPQRHDLYAPQVHQLSHPSLKRQDLAVQNRCASQGR